MNQVCKLNKLFLIRYSCLSIDKIFPLKNNNIIELVLKQDKYRNWLRKYQNEILNMIYLAVENAENDNERKYLIKLKRDLYNFRPTKICIEEIIGIRKNNKLRRFLLTWFSIICELKKIDLLGENCLYNNDQLLDYLNYHVKLAKSNNDFIKAMSLASPDLTQKILSYAEKNSRGNKKLQISLIKYLSRAAMKTSPFSSFTINALGEWGNSKDIGKYSFGEYNTFSRVNQSIVLRQNNKFQKKYIVNPTITISENRLVYLKLEDKGMLNFAFNDESIISLELNEILNFLLLQTDNNGFSKEYIIELLKKEFLNENHFDWENLIEELCSIHFFIKFIHPELDRNFLLEKDEDVSNIQIYNASAEFANKTAIDRINILNKLGTELQINHNNLLKYALKEDTLHLNNVPHDLKKYMSSISMLKNLTNILPLFDVSLRSRLSFATFFKNQNNRTPQKLLDFYASLSNKKAKELLLLKNSYQSLVFNPYNLDNINQINTLKHKIEKYIYNRRFDESILIETNLIKNIEQEIPPSLLRHPFSAFYFVQPNLKGELFLNKITSGFGRGFARYTYYNKNLESTVTNNISNYEKNNNLKFADIYYSSGFNGNMHPVLTEFSIDYYGTNTNLSGRIGLNEILIQDNDEQQSLVTTYNNSMIFPLHLGIMGYEHLPGLYRFLANITSFDHIPLTLNYYLFQKKYEKNSMITYIPEIRMESLIISRKQWWIDTSLLQDSIKAMNDWETMSYIINLLNKNNVPLKFFIRKKLLRMPNIHLKNDDIYKPQYIDLTKEPMFFLFNKIINQDSKFIIIEPILPDLEEQHNIDGEKRQIEFGIEFYKDILY